MTNEKVHRHLIASSVFETGNPWVDDALAGGYNAENLTLVAAKTGVGKTFYGVQLASYASRNNKNVHYFALEAEQYEIERRRLYYSICRIIRKNYPGVQVPRYREWLHAGLNPDMESIEAVAQKDLDQLESTLTTVYARGVYTPENFADDVADLLSNAEKQKPDLIILDHLHHFFLSGDEVDSLKTTIHQIKRLKDDLEIPVVVLAQLRKEHGHFSSKRTLPKIEDIRGTAALSDVATDVLIISRVPDEKLGDAFEGALYPMYFHFPKSRTASEITQFAAIVGFDPSNGGYQSKYTLTKVLGSEDPELVYSDRIPKWAKRAARPAKKMQTPLSNPNQRTLYDN